MIVAQKLNNRKHYWRKCFRAKEKETWISLQTSTNWALSFQTFRLNLSYRREEQQFEQSQFSSTKAVISLATSSRPTSLLNNMSFSNFRVGLYSFSNSSVGLDVDSKYQIYFMSFPNAPAKERKSPPSALLGSRLILRILLNESWNPPRFCTSRCQRHGNSLDVLCLEHFFSSAWPVSA